MFALSPRQRERLAGAVELYLFDGGYAGLQLVENGRANFCLVIGDSAWRARGGAWDDLVRSLTDDMPLLRERLEGAEPLLTRPLAVARIPYGFLHTRSEEHTLNSSHSCATRMPASACKKKNK